MYILKYSESDVSTLIRLARTFLLDFLLRNLVWHSSLIPPGFFSGLIVSYLIDGLKLFNH